ncbi:hypothetical protein V6V47_27100 [Micromonospora sp. CPCC 205539]|uniref:hypothetical protein n=1 Tax=Micromonospora sp. CPCC 205539 TaxID=3122408 RepID=UPI002FF07FEB
MSDDTSNRLSRHAERPDDVTDPLLWQLAVDVLGAHEPDDEGRCRNLQCADEPWPCAARTSAEQSLRLARGTTDTAPTWVAVDSDGWASQAAAARRSRNAGPTASHRGSASASAA